MADAVSNTIQSIDSLSANEFAVELEGESVTGVFRLTGFVPFKLDVNNTTSVKAVREPFKLVKMVQRDPLAPVNSWIRQTIQSRAEIVRPTRTLTIMAIDNGVEIRRWTVNGAWIGEIGYSDFDMASGDLVEERLTIHYEDIVETWSIGLG
ncbi:MAG: phage tail protein [Anaerolineaceae bacterium]|nr:phage tail protein [Anaerolineaceae bacterium]